MRKKILIALIVALGVATPVMTARAGMLPRQQQLQRFLANHPHLKNVVQAQKRRHVVIGQVQDVGDGYISIMTKKGEWVVEITSETKLRYKKSSISADQIQAGDRVIILGARSVSTNTVKALLVRKL